MVFFNLLCLSITLVHLVLVHFLIYLLIHIWILLFLIVGYSHFHLNAERSRKGKVIVSMGVRFAFVSHLTDQLVVMLSSCADCLMLVMLWTYNLLLVTLNLKLVYILRRGVSWLILDKLVTPVCSPILHFTVCFLVGLTTQTWFIVSLRRLGIYSMAMPLIAYRSWLNYEISIVPKVVYSR